MTSLIPALVTVVIPHYEGDILLTCLRRLFASTSEQPFDVLVVDDSIRSDGSVTQASEVFPTIRVLKTSGGRGFGAACNIGIKEARGKYVVLLNNDVEVASGWLPPVIDAMETDERLGICQPKNRSLKEPDRFDVGGGAGGMIDILGYPFALGSLIHNVETDHGQYDAPRELCWAHGAVMVLRRSMLEEIGRFDEEFFMQAEEIDLCLRALRAGWKIQSVPSATVYHHFGWTLKEGSTQRFYLSHRNTIVAMFKNWPLKWLVWALPVRALLEILAVPYGLFVRWNWKQPLGIIGALTWLATHPFDLVRRRRAARGPTAAAPDALRFVYRGSIIWSYFVRGIRTANQLLYR